MNTFIDVFEGRQIIKVGPDYIPFDSVKGHSIYTETEIRKGRQYLQGTASGTISGTSIGGHNSYGQWNTMSGHYSGNFNGTIDSDNDHVEENMTLCLSTGDMSNPVLFMWGRYYQRLS